MTCWNKEELENMLEDVVNELDLSESAIKEHGPNGTPPAELVKLVLAEKDRKIKDLEKGFVNINASVNEPTVKIYTRPSEVVKLEPGTIYIYRHSSRIQPPLEVAICGEMGARGAFYKEKFAREYAELLLKKEK